MSRSVLAIDSASDVMVVAFSGRDEAPVLRSHAGAREHTQELLRMINAVCAGRQEDLDAIVVVRGPGAYTGVRVGLATAQGLGLALDIPVEGAGTLEAVAAAARDLAIRGPVTAIHPAGRGDFAVQVFDEPDAAGEMALVHGDDISGQMVAGEGAAEFGGTEVSAEQRCLAAIRLARAGKPGAAEALYVREPHITLPRKTTIDGAGKPAPPNTEDYP